MTVYGAAGVSRYKNRFKVRVARDVYRVTVLKRNGHTDIDMESLPRPMNKNEIAQWFGNGDTWPREAQDAIQHFCAKHL